MTRIHCPYNRPFEDSPACACDQCGRKRFFQGVLAAYLTMATIAGFAMKAVIPALNPLGIAYVGLTWPVASGCVAVHADCSAIPPRRYSRYLFSFSDDTRSDTLSDSRGAEA